MRYELWESGECVMIYGDDGDEGAVRRALMEVEDWKVGWGLHDGQDPYPVRVQLCRVEGDYREPIADFGFRGGDPDSPIYVLPEGSTAAIEAAQYLADLES